MFRSLSTRLVALYVLVAIALVILAGGAVTAFALSTFMIGANEAQANVARDAPDLVTLYASRGKSLADAAPEIVQRLSRPGVRVSLIERVNVNGVHRVVSSDGPMGDGPGHVMVFNDGPPPKGSPGVRPAPDMGLPGGPPPMGFDRGPPLPMGLNFLFHIRPKHVPVPGGLIIVFVDPRPLARTISAFWTAMIPIGLLSIFAAWLLGRYITNQALRPLVETTAALAKFAGGDFTPRAIVSAERNEIGELVTAYNGAVQQVTRAFEERRQAELQMRQFVADAGHELRTPLTVIMGFIDVLRRRSIGGEAATTARIFDTMTAESRRMRTLIDKLIVLARLDAADTRETEEVALGDLASQVVASLAMLDPRHRLLLRVDSDAVARVDVSEVHEAIASLAENALKYAPNSIVEVSVTSDEQRAFISVVDHGDGLTAEECAHVFDRFYRGHQRGESEGFGLGLAIAKRAVERAGGEIGVASTPGQGATFTITLPRLAQRKRTARTA